MGIGVDILVEGMGWVGGAHESEGIAFGDGGCGTAIDGDCRSEEVALVGEAVCGDWWEDNALVNEDCRTVVGGDWREEGALDCRTVVGGG